MKYCRAMDETCKLSAGSVSAKVSNYKSIAGVNAHSNASSNSIDVYGKYGHLSILDIEAEIVRIV